MPTRTQCKSSHHRFNPQVRNLLSQCPPSAVPIRTNSFDARLSAPNKLPVDAGRAVARARRVFSRGIDELERVYGAAPSLKKYRVPRLVESTVEPDPRATALKSLCDRDIIDLQHTVNDVVSTSIATAIGKIASPVVALPGTMGFDEEVDDDGNDDEAKGNWQEYDGSGHGNQESEDVVTKHPSSICVEESSSSSPSSSSSVSSDTPLIATSPLLSSLDIETPTVCIEPVDDSAQLSASLNDHPDNNGTVSVEMYSPKDEVVSVEENTLAVDTSDADVVTAPGAPESELNIIVDLDNAEPIVDAVDNASSRAGTWIACYDDFGNLYYYDEATGASSWDPPPGFNESTGDTAIMDGNTHTLVEHVIDPLEIAAKSTADVAPGKENDETQEDVDEEQATGPNPCANIIESSADVGKRAVDADHLVEVKEVLRREVR